MCVCVIYSESMSTYCIDCLTGDVEGDDAMEGGILLADAVAEATCASICCFGKSCDGHSK